MNPFGLKLVYGVACKCRRKFNCHKMEYDALIELNILSLYSVPCETLPILNASYY